MRTLKESIVKLGHNPIIGMDKKKEIEVLIKFHHEQIERLKQRLWENESKEMKKGLTLPDIDS